ncbi:helix-turn-helix transcriptional regulator [Paenibacillus sedimenti]|uniref:Helix-turn-helix domain-containing protein n=1 Tax=Paenibacillus sedimenti TaxID=2770274 RepID=A0A926KP36_9BACL|nr:helix-turn-helix transcriptional regulator [Paenibacillus sedimenti]MBD0381422.1 helix-turn-helix domain-containing protein [Paenibacillus sedimenti]
MSNTKNIKTLGEFLKAKRAEVSPRDLNIAVGSGLRRTAGLRREEVAYLAGVSITWYTWLEQGREINVSKEVLTSIGNVLKLNDDEKAHLLTLGGFSSSPAPMPEEQAVNAELEAVIHSSKFPAFLVGARTNVLLHNSLANLIYPIDSSTDENGKNMVWLIFMNEEVRQSVINWEEAAKYGAGVFRGYHDLNMHDPWFSQFRDELIAKSAHFKQWWNDYHIQQKAEVIFEFFHKPIQTTIRYKLVSFFRINGRDDIHYCNYVPLPDDMEKYERLLQETKTIV